MSRDSDDRKQRERMAIEPTIPATDVRAGVPDFSSERPTDDAGPGRGTVAVIVGVVVVVGALFFWLGGSKPAPTTAATTAAPAVATKPPASTVKPTAKPAAKPTTAPAAAAPPIAAPATASATPSAPAPSSHAHKRHKKPTARAAKHKEVKLPRLPSPPPADP